MIKKNETNPIIKPSDVKPSMEGYKNGWPIDLSFSL